MKLRFVLIALVLLPAIPVAAQQAKIAPLPVQPSKFIDELRALKAGNPKMSPADLVIEGNKLLDKQGMNFSISLDQATCTKIRDIKQKQTDPNAPVRLSGALKSVEGERANLALPDARVASDECGGCYMEIPLLQITRTDFITILRGINVRFEFPANFSTVRVTMPDEKDPRLIKRSWSIPERLVPIGVSHDENVLYLAFKEPDLGELSLAVFTEGTFELATRAEAEDGGKGQQFPSASPAPGRQVRFIRWGKTFIVSYLEPCGS